MSTNNNPARGRRDPWWIALCIIILLGSMTVAAFHAQIIFLARDGGLTPNDSLSTLAIIMVCVGFAVATAFGLAAELRKGKFPDGLQTFKKIS